jgi:pimeloyl-ACP methyl ester carboxylesterase
MVIKAISYFKNAETDCQYFQDWVIQLENLNGRKYDAFEITSSLGNTKVYGINTKELQLETLIIFPGARTTSLIWDLDRGLDNLGQKLRIFLVETNGLPNLSEGKTPDIRSLDYGHWAREIIDKLSNEKVFIAGASFGGLICMKLGIVYPEKLKAAFLLNAGCLQPFSLSIKNLYYNLLPILSPTEANVSKFLDKAIFNKPNHSLSLKAEKLLIDYEVFALRRYKDKTQKPYFMDKELVNVEVPTFLIQGNKDLLFPFKKSISNARRLIKKLQDVKILDQVGHGIETHTDAMKYIGLKIRTYSNLHDSIRH